MRFEIAILVLACYLFYYILPQGQGVLKTRSLYVVMFPAVDLCVVFCFWYLLFICISCVRRWDLHSLGGKRSRFDGGQHPVTKK